MSILFVFCFSISGTSLNLIRGLFAKESGGLAGQDDDEQREGEGVGEHGNIPCRGQALDDGDAVTGLAVILSGHNALQLGR